MFKFPEEPYQPVGEIKPSVKKLYKVIQRHTGKVGGYGHNCSIYGEVTMGSFQKIVNYLKRDMAFNQDSIFLDIGSGLGKPNFHVLLDPGVQYSFGVELESLRYALSLHNLNHINEVPELSSLMQKPNIHFSHLDVTNIETFNPITHVYTFDVGMPPDTMLGMSKAMHESTSVISFVSFHKPKEIIEDYEFPVDLVGTMSTSMHGSSEGHKAYIFCHKGNKDIFLSVPRSIPRDSLLRKNNGDVQKVKKIEDELSEAIRGLTMRKSSLNITTRSSRLNSRNKVKESQTSVKKKNASKKPKHRREKIVVSDWDPVFRQSLAILEKEGYSKWVHDTLDVYFPKERTRRECSLKSMR